MAARISKIFLYKQSGKLLFYKEFNSDKKKILAVGREGCVARVSDFLKNISLNKNCFLFEGLKVKAGGKGGGGARDSDFFFTKKIK